MSSSAIGSVILEPFSKDVLLGRGAPLIRYEGNIHFRQVIKQYMAEYQRLPHKAHKFRVAEIVYGIVSDVGGRFLRRATRYELEQIHLPSVTRAWVQVVKQMALQKIKQAFRDNQNKGKWGDHVPNNPVRSTIPENQQQQQDATSADPSGTLRQTVQPRPVGTPNTMATLQQSVSLFPFLAPASAEPPARLPAGRSAPLPATAAHAQLPIQGQAPQQLPTVPATATQFLGQLPTLPLVNFPLVGWNPLALQQFLVNSQAAQQQQQQQQQAVTQLMMQNPQWAAMQLQLPLLQQQQQQSAVQPNALLAQLLANPAANSSARLAPAAPALSPPAALAGPPSVTGPSQPPPPPPRLTTAEPAPFFGGGSPSPLGPFDSPVASPPPPLPAAPGPSSVRAADSSSSSTGEPPSNGSQPRTTSSEDEADQRGVAL